LTGGRWKTLFWAFLLPKKGGRSGGRFGPPAPPGQPPIFFHRGSGGPRLSPRGARAPVGGLWTREGIVFSGGGNRGGVLPGGAPQGARNQPAAGGGGAPKGARIRGGSPPALSPQGGGRSPKKRAPGPRLKRERCFRRGTPGGSLKLKKGRGGGKNFWLSNGFFVVSKGPFGLTVCIRGRGGGAPPQNGGIRILRGGVLFFHQKQTPHGLVCWILPQGGTPPQTALRGPGGGGGPCWGGKQ